MLCFLNFSALLQRLVSRGLQLRNMIFLSLALVMALGAACQAQGPVKTAVLGQAQAGTVVKTPQVKATLWVDAPNGLEVGKVFWLGLELVHQNHWHTYWRNPGDSGLATDLQWTLPKGMTAQDIVWPAPKKIPIGTLANYGYEGTAMLVVPVLVDANFKALHAGTLEASSVAIELQAHWLVCKQECIPQEGQFQISVPIRGATRSNPAAFDTALKQQAQVLTGAHAALISDDGRTLNLRIAELPQALQNSEWTVFPQTPSILLNAAVPVLTQREGSADVLLQISPERMDSPAQMSWLLVQGKADAPLGPQWVVSTPVQGQWQEISDLAQPNLGLPVVDNTLMPAPASTWIIALLGALLGGLLLNFMPCVFPVLAIKLLSITQHSDSPRAMKQSAFAFSAGVVLSFFILGGLVLGLREAGTQLGWGFQLQSPWVVGGLAMLFAVMGLNLSGMFEFRAMVPSGLASAQWSNPLVNSAWSGVFAVLIASPCTAPFMGASLGLAIGLPAWQALPIFLGMGIGMAFPFLALSYRSDWVRKLPKPGAWMLTFKQFMAFPMYATVIWLMWVLGQQVGLDGVTGFMVCLLSLVLLLWALSLQGRVAHVLSAVALVLVGLSLWRWAEDWTQPPPHSFEQTQPANSALQPRPGPIKSGTPVHWQAWSADQVAQARQSGRPVFVDFTAAWCVTCQFNKKTTFSEAALLAQLAQKNVLLLKADWTRYDPAITKTLNELGRNGVPVYAWYAPNQPVKLLSELPSVAEIQSQLNLIKTSP